MLLLSVSLTTAIKDEREGLSCPSASLFQNLDPGYGKIQIHPTYINANVEETFIREPDAKLENGVVSVGFI